MAVSEVPFEGGGLFIHPQDETSRVGLDVVVGQRQVAIQQEINCSASGTPHPVGDWKEEESEDVFVPVRIEMMEMVMSIHHSPEPAALG